MAQSKFSRIWNGPNEQTQFEEAERAKRAKMSSLELAVSLKQERARALINGHLKPILDFRYPFSSEAGLPKEIRSPCNFNGRGGDLEFDWKGSHYRIWTDFSGDGESARPVKISCDGEVVLSHYTTEPYAKWVYSFKEGPWVEQLRDLPPVLQRFAENLRIWETEQSKQDKIGRLKRDFDV